ncbi:MAG: hypothetical protein H0W20_10815 [Chthoniobacterales bacterium]|nr:hypothetical protein [Chthoniobacterales bacterium]
MGLILLGMALLSIYANNQRARQASIETVTIAPAPASSPAPATPTPSAGP